MSYYDDSSLVMIPSGYKTSKVYSQKPTDGTGDLTFTRSNDTASRIGPNGLIERVRTNVVTYSQNFSDASWTKTALTISTSATANPVNGAFTAQDAIPTATLSTHRFFKLAGVASAANTWSIYAKAKGYNFITIVENGNTSASVSFNLSTGAVSTQISAVGQIQSLGNGWYRCSMIHTTAATPRFDVYVSPTDSISAYTADGTSGVTLFGAQAEASDFGATPYIGPTLGSAVSVGPVANVPRLDYLNSSCPRLLLEPQRTNSFQFSESFDNAYWTKQTCVVTANTTQTLDPSGYNGADFVVTNNGAASGVIQRIETITANQPLTLSVFLKYEGVPIVSINCRDNATAGNNAGVSFNVQTGVISTAAAAAGTCSNASATITNYGNGWYRCTLTFTNSATTSFRLRWYNDGVGNGVNGTFGWGFQFEQNASYATSYIPTLGSASTRGSDTCSKTGISSLIGQTEGTIFVDAQRGSATEFTTISISDGTINNRVTIAIDAQSAVRSIVVTSGTVQTQLSASLTGTRVKAAITYTASGFKLFYNGALVNSSTKAVFGATLSRYGFDQANGGNALFRSVNQTLLFPTALSDAQAIELTTL